MFGTQGVVEGGSYIEPGIQRVVIKEVTSGTSNSGKDYINFSMYKEGAAEDTSRDFKFYFSSEGAIKASSKKVLHLGTKMVTRAALDACSASTLDAYAANLNAALAGKTVRLVFDGEEYYKNGDIRVASKLNRLGDFAEACMPGAESPVVEDAQTRLQFNPEKHIVKAPSLDPQDMDAALNMPGDEY